MAAAEATLTKVLTPDAYEKLEETNEALKARCQEVIDSTVCRPTRRDSAPRAA